MKTWILRGALALGALFLVIQLVPYGRDHANPPVTKAATFTSPKVQQLITDSCADCHSNVTKWPWYTNVAPASWLVQSDVDGGRQVLNLSEWDTPQPSADDIAEQINSGEMPPLKYTIMPNHANGRLSDQDKKLLVAAFAKLYATDPPNGIKQGGGG